MPTIRRIVCPTDFSEPAARAVDYAADLARHFDAELLLVHVIPPSAYPLHNMANVAGFPNLRDELRRGVDGDMAEAKKRVGWPRVRTEVREGTPHDQILAAAADSGADLIVMATRGRSGLSHILLGSTAERVVRFAICPVLTMRAAE